jgi:lipopolysaccharide export system permease protein
LERTEVDLRIGKSLDRYVVREHVGPFFGGLALLTMILLLDRIFDLLNLLIKKGIGGFVVFEVFGLSLPFLIALTLPMAVLVSTLVAFGRLSQDLEVMASKSLGVSLKRMMIGPIVVAVIVAALTVVFNNTVLPESNHRLKNLMIDINQKKPAAQIRKGVFTKIQNYLVYVGDKNERSSQIFDVKIQEVDEDGTIRTIVADSGWIEVEKDTLMTFRLHSGEIHEARGENKETYRRLEFERQTVNVPMNARLIRKERKYRGDREMSASMLLEEVRSTRKKIAKIDPGDARVRVMERRINQLMVEVHKKYSIPFAAIVFVLVGAPIAALTRRGGYGSAFGISFLAFTLYYIFLVAGEELADRSYVSPLLAMWAPNVIFILIGVLFIRKEESR